MNIPLNLPAFLRDVQWQETDSKPQEGGLPYATHSGVLDLCGHTLRCYRLSDGRAIFDADDFTAFWNSLAGDAA
jgi:hypothetical protein